MKSLLLVTSPPACGKTFVSKELAKALNPIVYLVSSNMGRNRSRSMSPKND